MARIHHYPLQPMLVCDFQQLGKDYRIDHSTLRFTLSNRTLGSIHVHLYV